MNSLTGVGPEKVDSGQETELGHSSKEETVGELFQSPQGPSLKPLNRAAGGTQTSREDPMSPRRSRIHSLTHTYSHTHTFTHIHTYSHTFLLTHIHTFVHAHTHILIRSHSLTHTLTQTLTHSLTLTLLPVCHLFLCLEKKMTSL